MIGYLSVASTFRARACQLFVVFGLIGSKLGMPPQGGLFCDKCKSGVPAEGDSWCIGCSGLDVSQELLKLRWRQPGLRKVAEETVLNTARLLRAFSNLDQNLGSSSAGDTPRADRREAGRKSVPPPPPVPDRSEPERRRSRSRERRDGRSPIRRSGRHQELHPKVRAQPPTSREEEDEYTEESEEEEEYIEEDPLREELPVEVKIEGGHRRPPEPDRPPRNQTEEPEKRHSSKRSHKKKRKKSRGGKRHQKHYREVAEPFRRSHRRLKGDILELASSARAGLERRI